MDEMKEQLDTNLPARLTAQDEKFDETRFNVSDQLVSVYVGDRDIQSVQNFPAIILIPLEATPTDYTTGKRDLFHTIAMVVLVSNPDPDAGQRKAWTILRAAENVFESQAALWPLGVIGQYKTESISYSEIGGVQVGKDQTVWTSGIRATIRERVDVYISAQL
jgi:hypothetical protein